MLKQIQNANQKIEKKVYTLLHYCSVKAYIKHVCRYIAKALK